MSPRSIAGPDKEEYFHQMHRNGGLLLLPNIWVPLGAALLKDVGYAAVATSSSAMALSNGYRDGEKLPFPDLLKILKRITETVDIPVSADIERAYATNDNQLEEHIKQLIDTGIVGINYEDSQHDEPGMIPVEKQLRSIAAIRKAADEAGSKLFINARIDVYIKDGNLSAVEKLAEALRRGKAYKEAGADGLYPILLKDKRHIETLVKEVGLPLNLTLVPGIPDMAALKSIGVARVSLASGFLRHAVFSKKDLAEQLLKGEGWNEATRDVMPSDYLNGLIAERPSL